MNKDRSSPALKPISYEAPVGCGVSRRGFRLLLVLTLINTILLGMTVAGPMLIPFVRNQWALYQQRKAHREFEAALAAKRAMVIDAQKQCLQYTAAVDALIYAEDPGGVAQLTGITTRPGEVSSNLSPAGAALPACFVKLPKAISNYGIVVDPSESLLFLHERKGAVDAPGMLVIVKIPNGGKNPGDDVTAIVLSPATTSSDLDYRASTMYHLQRPGNAGPLRFYAGQCVADDPSSFTIHYTLGASSGQLQARLDRAGMVHMTSTGPLELIFGNYNYSP